MKIRTEVEFIEGEAKNIEVKEFDYIQTIKNMQSELNRMYKNCVKIQEIKFCIQSAGATDCIVLGADLSKTQLHDI